MKSRKRAILLFLRIVWGKDQTGQRMSISTAWAVAKLVEKIWTAIAENRSRFNNKERNKDAN